MSYLNTGLYFFAAMIMIISLAGDLFSGLRKDRSMRFFYGLLISDILMLLAGGVENFLLTGITGGGAKASWLNDLMAGISDMAYFGVLACFILYLDSYAQEDWTAVGKIAWAGALISMAYGVFWFVSDFTGLIYIRNSEAIIKGPAYLLGQAGGYVTSFLIIVIYLKRVREFMVSERVGFALFILIPFIGSLIRDMIPGITLMPILVTISVMIIQSFVNIKRELLIREQNTELIRIQTNLLMSRMKPHFIYNVLNTIYALCGRSAEEAGKATAMFAKHLRSSFVDMDSHKVIPLTKELEHVENYLAIEKLRFGEKLEILYDIRMSECMIPPMALQTVVENAVRHGIEKKPEGGQVLISAARDRGDCLIMVKDTGPGFEPSSEPYRLSDFAAASRHSGKDDERKPMGLYSAWYRIVHLCGGSFEISSKTGEGTTVLIRLAEKSKQ